MRSSGTSLQGVIVLFCILISATEYVSNKERKIKFLIEIDLINRQIVQLTDMRNILLHLYEQRDCRNSSEFADDGVHCLTGSILYVWNVCRQFNYKNTMAKNELKIFDFMN